ncbi:MAG: 50S ribosomal protein L7Ae [Candidatus Bilamarchaeaceae archaeon]
MAKLVDIEMPGDLIPQILEMLSVAKESGKVKKGINETTKAVERKTAQMVVIATDITPEEIAIHLPVLCKEKGIPYAFVPSKTELGKAVGIGVPTAAVAVENAGGATEKLQDIIKKLPKPTAKQ